MINAEMKEIKFSNFMLLSSTHQKIKCLPILPSAWISCLFFSSFINFITACLDTVLHQEWFHEVSKLKVLRVHVDQPQFAGL